jgi:glucose/arabinose dehydrogenase
MALAPGFPADPYVYVLYAYDHQLGSASAPPRWGDTCPSPPGPTTDGCVISGRLSRLRASGNLMTGSEQVLVEDWCQQYPSHSVGTLDFGPDGALYASAGDGASFNFADYGQDGSPLNPCGDPPGGSGATLTPPTAEGGALRAQDVRTTGDPTGLDGSIIRIDPATGAGLATNPFASSSNANARRIIAYGFRNPFRFTFRPGTSELFVGDVGWNDWEEIDRILDPTDGVAENFGWPCYEGNNRQPGYDALNLNICSSLSPSQVTNPFFKYNHTDKVVPGETCPVGSSSVSGLAFEFAPNSSTFPAQYQGALFFADYSRDCIWVMRKNGNPTPSPGSIDTFVADAANPVNLEFGPDGNLYYVDFDGGTIRRIAPTTAPPPPPPSAAFAAPVSLPAGTNTHGVTIADMNGDQKLDIVAANAGSSTVSRWLGNGDGTFGARVDFATGTTPKMVAVGDLNKDGRPDLVSANQDAGTVSVILANSSGGFAPKVDYAACTGTHEVAINDFNRDGNLDVIAACWGTTAVMVRLGSGTGTLGAATTYAVGSEPHSVVTGDFDGDGAPDAAVANRSSNSVSLLRGRGDGTFFAQVSYPVGSGPHSIRSGDVNGDGRIDLVTANEGSSNVSLLRGVGDGTFLASVPYATGSVPKGVAVADVNDDGRLDVLTANTAGSYPTCCQPGGNTVSVLSSGNGVLSAPATVTVGQTPFAVSAGDLDRDGDIDIATANWHSNDVTVLLNTTIGGGAPPPPGSTYLSDLTWASMVNGWGPAERDKSNGEQGSNDGTTISLNGVTYAKGLGTHAASDISYSVGSNCTRFKASVGIDDEAGGSNGTVVFQAFAGTTKVFDSGVMNGASATQSVDVSIAGATTLRLVVTNGGDNINYDHADWALARIECGTGGDTTPPTVTGKTPTSGATGVALDVSPTATFSEAMNPATLTTSTFTLVKQGQTTPVGATVSYVGNVATLDPVANLDPSTNYTATVKGGSAGAKDLAGNALAADVTWTFTTGTSSPPPTSTYLSDLTWSSMTNGYGPAEKDMSNGENGAADGSTLTLNGVTYAKGLGTHAASDISYALGPNCTGFKASVGIDDEVPGALGSVVFQVFAGTTKVFDSGVMNGSSATQSVDVSIAGASTLRLVVTTGGDNFNYDHGDWALARIDCGTGGDTTPPTVTARTPSPGATGVAVNVSPTATFSEAMNPATLTTGTFTLVKQGQSTPVAATVSYASQVATLDPTANLDPSSTYTATVKGGSAGAKDVAGNALAADATWTFTTGATTNQAPLPVIDTPAATLTWKVGDNISFTGHATDPESGNLPASALSWTLLMQHCPSNCHTHTIQSWPAVASGSFAAPDHEYPSYLELQLTATDPGGASTTVTRRLDPQTVVLSFATNPAGLSMSVNATSSTAPFTRTVIIGSSNSVTATSPQTLNSTTYTYSSWSDGGAQSHNIVAPPTATTYTATYTSQPTGSATYLSDLTWTSMVNGWGPAEKDMSNGEQAAGDGHTLTLNGTTYAKGIGVHAASDISYALGANCTRFKASVGVDDEVGGSNGTVVFQAFAGTTKVFDSGVMNGASATQAVDVSIAGATTLRLVVTNGGDNLNFDHGDWALARIECGAGGGGDTTPPTVTGTSPSAGSTGIALDASPTATFSEAMDPSTLTTTTFTLVKQGQTTPVTATVSYASQVATLDPSASLEASTTYTATVKGGSSGAKDAAGNALAADVTWSFTTGASSPPPTSTYLSDLTWTSMTNGYGPAEKDMSNGESGSGDGTTLTLNGVTYAKGLGTHAASDISYALGSTCTRFKASVGIDDEAGGSNGTVVFQVFAGATKVFDSGVMNGASATQLVDVSIAGASTLRLVVTTGGDTFNYDHGDWALARIEC